MSTGDKLVEGTGTLNVRDTNYDFHVYEYDGDQIWSEDKVFGDEGDVATETEYAKNTIIVKVNGNLTIEERSKNNIICK